MVWFCLLFFFEMIFLSKSVKYNISVGVLYMRHKAAPRLLFSALDSEQRGAELEWETETYSYKNRFQEG